MRLRDYRMVHAPDNPGGGAWGGSCFMASDSWIAISHGKAPAGLQLFEAGRLATSATFAGESSMQRELKAQARLCTVVFESPYTRRSPLNLILIWAVITPCDTVCIPVLRRRQRQHRVWARYGIASNRLLRAPACTVPYHFVQWIGKLSQYALLDFASAWSVLPDRRAAPGSHWPWHLATSPTWPGLPAGQAGPWPDRRR